MTSDNPSDPKKIPSRLNLFIGGSPPPGAAVFTPDGTIEHTPDTPEARNEWTVRKMTASINREPDNGKWYFERGMALFELDRFAEAIPDFSKLIELIPEWGDRITGSRLRPSEISCARPSNSALQSSWVLKLQQATKGINASS